MALKPKSPTPDSLIGSSSFPQWEEPEPSPSYPPLPAATPTQTDLTIQALRHRVAELESQLAEGQPPQKITVGPEETLQGLLTAARVGLGIFDQDQLEVANPAFLAIFGNADVAEFNAAPLSHHFSPESLLLVHRSMQSGLNRNPDSPQTLTAVRHNGGIVTIEASFDRIEWQGTTCLLATCRDTTEENQALETLRHSERRYWALFKNSPFETIIVDSEGRVSDYNIRRLEAGRQRPEDRPPRIGDRMYTEDYAGRHEHDMRAELMDCIRSSRHKSFSKLAYGNRNLSIEMLPFPDGAIITAIDVTDRVMAEREKKTYEAQLLQSRKMEAIGTLAGGIAHDFNNILWVISGNTELAAADLEEDSPTRKYLSKVGNACGRARDLVSQILSFSRQTPHEKKPLDLIPVVRETLKLLRASLPSTIDIRQDIAQEAISVFADTSKMSQMIMNLATNAAQAMGEDGGVLSVRLHTITLTPDLVADYHNLPVGQYASLAVTDTGRGISSDVIDRIFDPFFSTKRIEEAYGMGLAVVHGIIKDHDGTIVVSSSPGEGSRFRVLLPLVAGEIDGVSQEPAQPMVRGAESLMVVDDDEALLEMEAEMLRHLGYRVTPINSSTAALDIFRQDPNRYDLVITDQTMPHITGLSLARELRRTRPTLPIILVTGYSDQVDADALETEGIGAFLMKPVIMANLSQVIRRLLDAPAQDAVLK